MDELVRAAMEKWPDVPALFHWLSLDARGRWRLKGELISNPALNDFIGRNYSSDEHGRWYFQNGPQRVFVSLEAAPWIVRIDGRDQMVTHTGLEVTPTAFVMDEIGHLYAVTDRGLAKVDDRDLATLANKMLEQSPSNLDLHYAGRQWHISTIAGNTLPERFGFDPDPGAETTQL